MPDKIVNHFVLADGSTAKYDAGSLVNLDETVSLAGYAPDAKAVGDKVTELKSELTDETNARILLAGRMTTAEGDIDTLETHKVAQPLDEYNQPIDGTDGQSLRTKGDGTTEWADVGLPTDAQTAQAVSDWLDDHPEATTTVQDDSLTTAKYKNGSVTTPKIADGAVTGAKVDTSFLKTIENAYVTPEQFGAVGDGVTDDTLAINNALTFCNEHGCALYAKAGTYIFDGALEFGNIILFGDGVGKTIFKLKDNCTVPQGRFITGFSVKSSLSDITCVIFKDFEIDGNARNNRHWTSTSYGSWSGLQDSTQSNGIRIENIDLGGGTSNNPDYIELSGLYIHDTIRDNVSIVSDGFVSISNCKFKNSDTDHLLYLQTYTGSTFVDNVVCSGFCCGGYVQTACALFDGVLFDDLTINPALANSTQIINACFTTIDRSGDGQKTNSKISNVHATIDTTDFTGNNYFFFLEQSDFVEAENIEIEIIGSGNFSFFDAKENNTKTGLLCNNLKISGMGAKSCLLRISHLIGDYILINNAIITFSERPTNKGLVEVSTSKQVKGVVLNNVVADNIWNAVRCFTDISAGNVGKVQIKNSFLDIPTDTYVIDGSVAYNGFLELENVKLASLRNNATRPYVWYKNVLTNNGNIKYTTQPPINSFIGDVWFYQGAIKFWNGSTWD